MQKIIDRIVTGIGRRIDESSPMVDARLADGSRVNAIIPPLSIDGPITSIRRFAATPLKMADLIGNGTPIANSRCNVNKAARNMIENVADTAHGQGVLIMSVGLGAALRSLEITFCGYGVAEDGEHILKRLANASDSDTLKPPPQAQGLYCYAGDAAQLPACFDRIASAILRLVPQP